MDIDATGKRVRLGIRNSVGIALASGVSYWLALVLHLGEPYWAPISAAVVMQAEVQATETAAAQRTVGTAIGVAMGWAVARAAHFDAWWWVLGLVAAVFVCYLVGVGQAGRICAVSVIVVVLVPHQQPIGRIAWRRFIEVILGIAVALPCAMLMDRRGLISSPASSNAGKRG